MVKTGKIKALREHHKMTQENMACLLNISQPTYARLESGRQKISIEQLINMASILKVTLTDLLEIPHSDIDGTSAWEQPLSPPPHGHVVLPNDVYREHMKYTLRVIAREHEERKALVAKIKARHAANQPY